MDGGGRPGSCCWDRGGGPAVGPRREGDDHDEPARVLFVQLATRAPTSTTVPRPIYHLNALAFFLFGDSDVTARLVPALIGVLVVACSGCGAGIGGGAFVTAALVAVSPTLLFYSRHIRNDIYIACFTLLWACGVIRYLGDSQRRWFLTARP